MGTVTFLFLDEADEESATTSRRGVLGGDVLAGVRACITARGGQELDLTVDGLGVVFPSAAAGVAAARAMQLAVRAINGGGPSALRVGVHTGEPLAIPGGRYFGAAVWLAARLHKRAAPGQVLISDTVFELLDPPGRARCVPVGSLDLKGLSDRVVAFDASWNDATDDDAVGVVGLRTVTLLTVDQVGSTAQIDLLGDESARAIHAALLDVLREAIGDHGGREVEYTGDGVSAMFDAALDATGCAVAMQQAAYRHRLRYPSEPGLALRVGIQTAEAVEADRDTWTDTAQQCALLCTSAGDGDIVVSRLVRAITAPRRMHVFEPAAGSDGSADIDGARFGLRWEPELSEFSLPADLVATRGQFGFVGRHAELERLVRLWAEARAGSPRVALVSGVAGIGKSSIVAHLAEVVGEDASTIVLYGRCRTGDGEPFGDALARYVAATSRADLRRQLGAHAPVLTRVIPGLDARLPDVSHVPVLPDDVAIGQAVEAFVAAIAQTAPVLLVIDDVHNASSSTLRVLRQVAATGGSVALMVVGLFRNPPIGRSPVLDALGVDPARHDRTDHFVLESLPDRDVARLVEAVTGVAPSALARDAIAAQSNGVPYAVVELARTQMEQGVTADLRRALEHADTARLNRRDVREEIARGVLEIQRLRQPLAAIPETATGSVDRDGTPPAFGPCPYRGLESFNADDAEWFFGREHLVAELVAHVAGSRLVGVLGASGSGKSSLVRAGLVPALAARALPGADRWLSLTMTPTARPLQALALACATTGRISGEAARALLDDGEIAPLIEWLVDRSAGEQVVLVVDQFEELFTAAFDDERERFVNMVVAAAADADLPVTIVVVLRADFYGACAQHPDLADRLEDSQVLVGAMTDDEIRRTIEHPARRAGLVLETGFVDAVIADVSGEPGGLPLLSTALLETWERRRGHSLTLAAYAETGGVRSAVARLADTVYNALDPAQRVIARRILLRLARPAPEDTIGDVRRRAQLSELVADDPAAQHVLGRLVERRLVTTDEHTAEVAHEAVLREWPQLREWLADDREGRRIHHQLADATHDWQNAGHDPELLYRGARLAAATDYATMHAADLNPLEHEFLTAGRARATADLEASQRSTRRFRRLTTALAVILAVALAAGTFAFTQRNDARSRARALARQQQDTEHQRFAGLARQLSLQSEAATIDGNTDLSSALAAQSAEFAARSAGVIGEGAVKAALVDALQQNPRQVGTLRGLSGSIAFVAVSPDGSRAAAVTGDGRAGVWDLPNEHILSTFRLDSRGLGVNADQNRLQFLDADTLALAGDTRVDTYHSPDRGATWTHEWTWATRSLIVAIATTPARVLVASSSDPSHVVAHIDLLDAAGRRVASTVAHPVDRIAVAPSGAMFATAGVSDTGGGGGKVLVHVFATPSIETASFSVDLASHQGAAFVSDVRFSRTSRELAVLTSDPVPVHRWNVETRREIPVPTPYGGWSSVVGGPASAPFRFGPDLDSIVQNDPNHKNSFGVGHISTATFTGGLAAPVSDLHSVDLDPAFAPDGQSFLLATGYNTVPIFALTGAPNSHFARTRSLDLALGINGPATIFAVSRDATLLASLSNRGGPHTADHLRITTIDGSRPPVNVTVTGPGTVESNESASAQIVFDDGGDAIAVARADNSVKVYDTATGALRLRLPPPGFCGRPPYCGGARVAISGSLERGRVVELFLSAIYQARTWNLRSGVATAGPVLRLNAQPTTLAPLLNASGTRLVVTLPSGPASSGRSPMTIHVFDATANGWSERKPLQADGIQFEMLSPDGSRLTFGDGETETTFDLDRDRLVWRIRAQDTYATLGADGTLYSVDGFTGAIRVRSAADGNTEYILQATTEVNADLTTGETRLPIAIVAAGSHLVAIRSGPPANQSQGVVSDWPLATSDLVAAACKEAGRNLTRTEWTQYVGTYERYTKTCTNLP